MPLRTLDAIRYVTPLREGGSLPAIVEAGDEGLYVLKFRGAGQGANALVAELVAGEIARAAGLPVPELVLVELDADLARTEPDPEIQDLIRASAGTNLALDYLPGATTFDPVADTPDATLAARIVWFDALVINVDRTPRNPNLLVWHRQLWMIDHGAALVLPSLLAATTPRAAAIRSRNPRPRAAAVRESARRSRRVDGGRLDERTLREIVALVPDAWLRERRLVRSADARREAYVDYLRARLAAPRAFVEEALRARVQASYDYAVIRVVPRVEREEFVNVGVIVSCPSRDFLEARIEFDPQRIAALDATLDLETIREHLAAIPIICRAAPRPGRSGACRRASASIGWSRRAARSSRRRRRTAAAATTRKR